MPWKHQMLVVLHNLRLESYIAKDAAPTGFDNPQTLMKDKEVTLKKWHEGNTKAQTRIELTVGDMEMIHLSGVDTAKEMWDQLYMVKEVKGWIGVLATHCALYHMEADESNFDLVDHISKLQRLQEELYLMDNRINDEDFVMILVTSLPESWDVYTSAYLGSSSNNPTLRSHKLIAIYMKRIAEERDIPQRLQNHYFRWKVLSRVAGS